MNEDNVTQERVKEIAYEQERIYIKTLEKLLVFKGIFLTTPKPFEAELFPLEKVISHNKRLGYKYAVVRDEVLIKSYELIRTQNTMSKDILRALDNYDLDEFEQVMNDLFVKNQVENQAINSVDYKPYLQLKDDSKTLQQAQKNIRDFYAILEINADVLKYFAIFENRMYRLNKYSKYYLIAPILYINDTTLAKSVDPILKPVGLNTIKVLLIVFVFILIYFIRKLFYKAVKSYLAKTTGAEKYSSEILEQTHRSVNIIIILINIEMTAYIYNNFHSFEMLDRLFNMTYAFFFTLIVYKVLNIVATIKIETFDHSNNTIKSEMINVGIKIINFIIMILGILLILHFAGANLTAVLSGLGIGGFAVALAARESLSNFFGTISILLSDVFSQGDWIVVDGHQGVVVEIGLRVTTLRTFDNALIAIPNATLANHDVKNWNKRKIGRRIKMNLGVKYDSKAENIQNAVTQIREMLRKHPELATEKTSYQQRSRKSARLVSKEDDEGVKRTLLVYLDEFSDSSINILVYCFTKTTDWNEWLLVKEDVMYKIMKIFEENALEFAFPSISLYNEESASDE